MESAFGEGFYYERKFAGITSAQACAAPEPTKREAGASRTDAPASPINVFTRELELAPGEGIQQELAHVIEFRLQMAVIVDRGSAAVINCFADHSAIPVCTADKFQSSVRSINDSRRRRASRKLDLPCAVIIDAQNSGIQTRIRQAATCEVDRGGLICARHVEDDGLRRIARIEIDD